MTVKLALTDKQKETVLHKLALNKNIHDKSALLKAVKAAVLNQTEIRCSNILNTIYYRRVL